MIKHRQVKKAWQTKFVNSLHKPQAARTPKEPRGWSFSLPLYRWVGSARQQQLRFNSWKREYVSLSSNRITYYMLFFLQNLRRCVSYSSSLPKSWSVTIFWFGDACWTAQIMLSNCPTKRNHPEKITRPHNWFRTSILIYDSLIL